MEKPKTTRFQMKLEYQNKIFVSDVEEVESDHYLNAVDMISQSIIKLGHFKLWRSGECFIFGSEVIKNSIVTITELPQTVPENATVK